MPRRPSLDRETLEAALIGFQLKSAEVTARIAELRKRLGVKASDDGSVEPQPKIRRRRRRFSAAGRKRMAEAQRKRWADYRAKIAAKTAKPKAGRKRASKAPSAKSTKVPSN